MEKISDLLTFYTTAHNMPHGSFIALDSMPACVFCAESMLDVRVAKYAVSLADASRLGLSDYAFTLYDSLEAYRTSLTSTFGDRWCTGCAYLATLDRKDRSHILWRAYDYEPRNADKNRGAGVRRPREKATHW